MAGFGDVLGSSSETPAAAAGGAAPQSGRTQTDGLLSGAWGNLARDLTRAYAVQRIGEVSPVAQADTEVISAPGTVPTATVIATPRSVGGFFASPMGLGLLAVGALALWFVVRK